MSEPVQKLGYWIPINLREERLNNLSDLAIGEAHGGPIGRAIADQARRNLAVLDEMEGLDAGSPAEDRRRKARREGLSG